MENNYALYDNVNYDIMNTIVAYRQFLLTAKHVMIFNINCP